jgi:hypothetical protein
MIPEEGVINPSSLTKFRKLCLKDDDLLNIWIGKTVSIVIILTKSIIVDATHITMIPPFVEQLLTLS